MAVSPERRGVGALLFLQAGMTTLDAYSTLNSSPWTAENFGADPDKARSCRGYVRHAIVFSTGYAVAAALLGESILPIVGATIANVYLYWLYERGLSRAVAAGSTSWAKS